MKILNKMEMFFLGIIFGIALMIIIFSTLGTFYQSVPISERKASCEEKGGKYQLLYSKTTGYNESCIAPEVLQENRFIKDF